MLGFKLIIVSNWGAKSRLTVVRYMIIIIPSHKVAYLVLDNRRPCANGTTLKHSGTISSETTWNCWLNQTETKMSLE